jgi:hypothetical protein
MAADDDDTFAKYETACEPEIESRISRPIITRPKVTTVI